MHLCEGCVSNEPTRCYPQDWLDKYMGYGRKDLGLLSKGMHTSVASACWTADGNLICSFFRRNINS